MLRCLILLICTATFTYGLDIRSFTPNRHNRFANSSEFILNGYNLSGWGRHSGGGWAVLIYPNVFVTATHRGVGEPITFHTNNDPNGPVVERTIKSTTNIGDDVRLGILDEPVPTSIKYYPVYQLQPSDILYPDRSNPNGRVCYVGGSSQSNLPTLTDFAVGIARLEYISDNNMITSWGYGNNNPDWAQYRSGDSGAPIFTIFDNKLHVIGTAYARYSYGIQFTALPLKYDRIQEFINTNGVYYAQLPSKPKDFRVIIQEVEPQ